MSDSKNKPAETIKAGAIKATIWANTATGGKTFHTVSIVRLYMKGEEWKETTSFGRDDLPKLNQVTTKAYEWILAQKPEAKKKTARKKTQ